MKKTLLILPIIIIVLVMIIIMHSRCSNKNLPNLNTNFSFYKPELRDRYLHYKTLTNLNDKRVIIDVNIGLDRDFYTNPKMASKLDSISILVNKYNYLPDTYVPNNLVLLTDYSKKGISLVSEVYEAFKKMARDAELNNLKIRIVSAYRSYDYQSNLYNNYLKDNLQNEVDKYSARPGFSEHQTGLAIDIDNGLINYDKFHLTQEFTWAKNNCYKYGFILRYDTGKENITGYQYEPWHYRYVGIIASEYIYKNNITFEEYYYEFLD